MVELSSLLTELKKGALSMVKSKQFYFIQLNESFFQSEDMEALSEAAQRNKDAAADYFIFYIKLMLASLATDGVIYSDNKPLTAAVIKRKTRFNLHGDYGQDLEIVNRAMETLIKERIVTQTADAIIVNNLGDFVGSKKLKSEQRQQERRRANNLITKALKDSQEENIKLKTLQTLTDTDNADYILDGLIYSKFITKEEKKPFMATLQSVMEDYNAKDFYKAANVFIKRMSFTDISKIKDKNNYFKQSIENIYFNEIRNASYYLDEILDDLTNAKIITRAADMRDYKDALNEFLKDSGATPEYVVNLYKINKFKLLDNKQINTPDGLKILLSILFKQDKSNIKSDNLDKNISDLTREIKEENRLTPEMEEMRRIANLDIFNN